MPILGAAPFDAAKQALRQAIAQRLQQPEPVVSESRIAPVEGWDRLKSKVTERLWEPFARSLPGQAMGALGQVQDEGFRGQTVDDPRWKLGMTVFHGSPYKFNKFDMSKVGTGEGAQAYGHGLYFAENPRVAGEYARKLGNASYPPEEVLRDYFRPGRVVPSYGGHDRVMAFTSKGGDWNVTVRRVVKKNGEWVDAGEGVRSHQTAPEWKEITAATGRQTGVLYDVDLPDEAIGKMLDWDAPLSQQPALQQALYELPIPQVELAQRTHALANAKGETVYRQIEQILGGPSQASTFLRSRGLTGIKYLDQMSRDAGHGTRNFVIFDDQLPKIVGEQ